MIGRELLRAVYAGGTLRPAPRAVRAIVDAAWRCLRPGFGGPAEARLAWRSLEPGDHFARLGRARSTIAADEALRRARKDLLDELGLVGRVAVDCPRLRAIVPHGHESPLARAAYTAHRDTWFANPHAQVNLWIGLHDVSAADSFELHPDVFARVVPNDSARFDHDRWRVEVGWQCARPPADAVYPTLLGEPPLGPAVPVATRSGEVFVFSAHHLHRTRRLVGTHARFSLEVRVIDLDDHDAGLGPANVDSACTGSALADYELP